MLFHYLTFRKYGPGSSVGIATGYELDGHGTESRWGRDFSHLSRPGLHPPSCKMGTGSFPGVECGRGVTLTPHPLLVPRSKSRVELYLYTPQGPSWPVKRVKPTYLQFENNVMFDTSESFSLYCAKRMCFGLIHSLVCPVQHLEFNRSFTLLNSFTLPECKTLILYLRSQKFNIIY
jgi:hypothetical protein